MIPPPPRSTLFPYTTLFRSYENLPRRRVSEEVGEQSDLAFLAPFSRFAGDRVEVLVRSEEHTSELQSLRHLVCRLLLENKKCISRLYELDLCTPVYL